MCSGDPVHFDTSYSLLQCSHSQKLRNRIQTHHSAHTVCGCRTNRMVIWVCCCIDSSITTKWENRHRKCLLYKCGLKKKNNFDLLWLFQTVYRQMKLNTTYGYIAKYQGKQLTNTPSLQRTDRSCLGSGQGCQTHFSPGGHMQPNLTSGGPDQKSIA